MVALLLLAAAMSQPASPVGHQLAAELGYGVEGPIFVVSWTGRRRWGAWFRLDQDDGRPAGKQPPAPFMTHVYTTAGSIGLGWRVRPRLSVGLGYGQEKRSTTSYGADAIIAEEHREDDEGPAVIGTGIFPVNDTLGVAASATYGPSGFGASVGATFFFP